MGGQCPPFFWENVMLNKLVSISLTAISMFIFTMAWNHVATTQDIILFSLIALAGASIAWVINDLLDA